jgi:hypothetical protein
MRFSLRASAAAFATMALIIGVGAACTTNSGGGGGGGGGGGATSVVIYNSNPAPLPGDVNKHGFECCATSEFGDAVHLAGTARQLTSATVTLSTSAVHSAFPTVGNTTGWDEALTLKLYTVGSASGLATAGTVLGARVKPAHIPWRPEHNSATCSNVEQFQSTPGPKNTNCFSGQAIQVTFDLTGIDLTGHDTVVWGLSFNTKNFGAAPIHVDGPWDLLSVGAQGTAPSVGTQVTAGTQWMKTQSSLFYCDGATVGTFRSSGGGCYTGSIPEISFSATA